MENLLLVDASTISLRLIIEIDDRNPLQDRQFKRRYVNKLQDCQLSEVFDLITMRPFAVISQHQESHSTHASAQLRHY